MMGSKFITRRRSAILALAVLLAVPLGSSAADARAGFGLSSGSRGTRTFSMPAPTATAPRPIAPLQRTETPQTGAATPGFGATAQPRRFGFGSGLMAGLLGAGLFGLLTGGGFGDIGGLGLLFQIVLIGGLVVLALRFFRGRAAGPALAGVGAVPNNRTSAGFGTGGGAPGGPPLASGPPLAIGPQDFAAFERSLGDIQTAYGREDFNGLSRLTTPEMLRVFGAEIEDNQRRGRRNEVSDPRLLQGDLSEAWREGATDYASVAMRFSVRDIMVDRASGRPLSGDPARPSEATELWTFRRDRGGPWLLSAIQQTG